MVLQRKVPKKKIILPNPRAPMEKRNGSHESETLKKCGFAGEEILGRNSFCYGMEITSVQLYMY